MLPKLTSRYLGAILLLLATNVLFAQDTNLDALLAAKDDSVKVKKLLSHASGLSGSDVEKARSLLKSAVEISKQIDFPYGAGQALVDLGVLQGQEAKDREAVASFKMALPYFERANMVDKVAGCLLNIGACSERYGDVQGKMEAVMKAINLLEHTHHKTLLIHGYNSLGILFYNMNNFPKAAQYFGSAMKEGTSAKDTSGLIQALFGMSNCRAETKSFDQAYRYASEALRLADASGKQLLLLRANTSLSDLFIKWRKAPEAIHYSEKVLAYATTINDAHYQLIGYMNLADGYSLAGNQLKRIQYLQQALAIAEKNDVVIQLDDLYKGLAESYELAGKHKDALYAHKKYVFYKDSANSEQTNRAVAELEIKYKTAQKEKALSENQLQMAKKDLELQKSRMYTVYGGVGTIVAFLVTALIYLHLQNKKKLHVKQIKSLEQEKELQLLQAAMEGEEKERARIAKDLHDGVAGMLVAVKMHLGSVPIQHESLIKEDAYRQGIRLLDEAYYEVRKTSHNLMPDVLLQHGLDNAIRRYCNNISNPDVLLVQYDSWGDIGRYKNNFEISVYRIVQELLNNVVKHSRADNALVQVSRQSNLLCITVEDNGVGFAQGSKSTDGMGMFSVQSRVQALNGTMEVNGEPGAGVSVYLEFDINGMERQEVLSSKQEKEHIA